MSGTGIETDPTVMIPLIMAIAFIVIVFGSFFIITLLCVIIEELIKKCKKIYPYFKNKYSKK